MDELTIEKKKYISSKRAAKLSGYTKDYIGQLCRAGSLPAKMVGRSWYIEEDALTEHRKTYQGEPIIDSSVWDRDHVEEDSRPLHEIAAEYTSKQDQDEKTHLLNKLFNITYKEDSRPLLPTLEEKKTASPIVEEHKVNIHTEEEGADIVEEKASPRLVSLGLKENKKNDKEENFPLISPVIPESAPRVVYFDPDEVDRPVSRVRKRRAVTTEQGEPTKRAKQVAVVAVASLLVLLLSSVFVDQTKVYERRGDTYIESAGGLVLRGWDGVTQKVHVILASVVSGLE